MSRRRRERALAPTPAEPLDRGRALARFRCLVARRVEIGFGFVPLGPVAQAESPRELDETFEEWLAAETSRQRPS